MSQPHSIKKDHDVDYEQALADYLSENPEYFSRHPELLANLRIPHPRGNAISLIEKQLESLRQQNQQYKTQLAELISIARSNELLEQRFHRLTLALIDAATLDEVLNALEDELHDEFGADAVEIRLADSEFLNDLNEQADLKPLQQAIEEHRILCGPLNENQRQYLFSGQTDTALSAALLPLYAGELSGLLAIGSRDKQRFLPDMGTDFLTRLSNIVSKTLEVVCEPGM